MLGCRSPRLPHGSRASVAAASIRRVHAHVSCRATISGRRIRTRGTSRLRSSEDKWKEWIRTSKHSAGRSSTCRSTATGSTFSCSCTETGEVWQCSAETLKIWHVGEQRSNRSSRATRARTSLIRGPLCVSPALVSAPRQAPHRRASAALRVRCARSRRTRRRSHRTRQAGPKIN